MSGVDARRLAEVFAEASERAGAEREAYLARACAGDAALRREVEELLRFDGLGRVDVDPAAAAASGLRSETTGAAGGATAPATIGRFRIERVLGVGGMGVVYAAQDPTLGRTIALKLVRSSGSAEAQARLVREARAMAQIASPYVVPVYEVGTAGADVFIAMEYVPGATLAQWLRAQERSVAEVLARFVEAGRGLAAAHRAGVLHRDFKPANVLVGDDGRARVVDFGLARAAPLGAAEHAPRGARGEARDAAPSAALADTLTAHGAVMGTPGYLSPEHFLGGIGPASDQWSFGAALYRALFGAAPCAGATLAELRESVLRGPDPPPRADLEPAVVACVLRALEPDPARRFASMEALLAVLEASLAVDPELDPRRFRRQRQRAMAIVGALGASNFVGLGLRTGFRFDIGVGVALASIAGALGVLALVCVVFRRTVLATAHSRRVVALFALAMAAMAAHRAYALARGLDVRDVLRVDAIFTIAFALVGALALERWLLGSAAIMAGYLAVSLAFAPAAVPLFPPALLACTALAVWNWRAVSLGQGRAGLGHTEARAGSSGSARGARSGARASGLR